MTGSRGLGFEETDESNETTNSEFANNRAFVIGIDAYQNGIPPLHTAVADAERLGQLLTVAHDYTTTVFPRDGATSLAGLQELLHKKMPEEVGADDRVLVYFAGHGIALDGDDGPEGFLVPSDANREDRTSFLSMTELNDALADLPCRHLLLILDCCFAGAFRWSSTRDLNVLPSVIHRERFDRYIQDPAWQVLTSAAYDQKALDVLSGNTIGERIETASHSPFALALHQALAGDADVIPRRTDGEQTGDGVITATELYMYLRECVETATEEQGTRQTPGLWPLKKHDNGEFILFVPGQQLDLPPAPELNYANNPYRGLQSFDEEQSPLFFGRSKVVEELVELVDLNPLTIVLGASGTGKSSVVKAGLLPKLRGVAEEDWQVFQTIRPGKSPLATLADLALPGESPNRSNGLLARDWSDENAFADRIESWTESQAPDAHLVLAVDQFEELVTLCGDDREREQFLQLLAGALRRFPDRLRIVITLRSDFEPQFTDCPLKDLWAIGRYIVPPMSTDELREAIVGPASVRVLYFQPPELVDQLVDEVIQTPGALPLLSFTLSELYVQYLERKGDDRCLTSEDYDRLGGVVGSLRSRATELYDGLDDKLQMTMERMMLRMVSARGGEIARRRIPKSELVYTNSQENERVASVLFQLVSSRLVVEGKEVDGEPYVEPAHDALVSSWDKLLAWTRQEQEQLLLRRLLTSAATDWQNHKGGTWHANPRLSLLRRVRGSEDNWLNATEESFVGRSIAKRRKILVGATSFVATAFVVLSIITLSAIASNQETHRLLAASYLDSGKEQQLFGDYEKTVAYFGAAYDSALAAGRKGKSEAKTASSLIGAWSPTLGNPLLHDGPVTHVAISPDGTKVAAIYRSTLDHSQFLLFWDAENGVPLGQPTQLVGYCSNLMFSPNSKAFFTQEFNDEGLDTRFWDATNGKPLGGSSEVFAISYGLTVAYHPTHQWAVVARNDDKTGQFVAQVIDTNNGELIGKPMHQESSLTAVGFRGTSVVTGQRDRVQPWVEWNWKTGRQTDSQVKIPDSPTPISVFAFSSDGQTADTRSATGIQLRNMNTGEKIGGEFPFNVQISFPLGNSSVFAASQVDMQNYGWVQLHDGLSCKKIGQPIETHSAIEFSFDGKFLMSGRERSVLRWDTASGEPVAQPIEITSSLRDSAIARDGTVVTVDAESLFARIHDGPLDISSQINEQATDESNNGSNGKEVEVLCSPLDSQSQVVVFSPDGKSVLTRTDDARNVQLWREGKPVGPPLQHPGPFTAAAFSDNGQLVTGCKTEQLVTPGYDEDPKFENNLAQIWDCATGEAVGPPLKCEGPVSAVAFTPDGEKVIVATSMMQVANRTSPDAEFVNYVFPSVMQLWDAKTFKQISQPVRIQTGFSFSSFESFAPDGGAVLTSGGTGVDLWFINPDFEPEKNDWSQLVYHYGMQNARRASFSVNGEVVIAITDDGLGFCLENGMYQFILQREGILSVAQSTDKRTLITGENDGVYFWNTNMKPSAEPLPHSSPVIFLRLDSEDSSILTGCKDGSVRRWNVSDVVKPYRDKALAISPDSTTILRKVDGKRIVQLWREDQPVGTPMWHDGKFMVASFSPNGTYLVTGSKTDFCRSWMVRDDHVRLWDAGSGALINEFDCPGGVACLAWSPDERHIAVGMSQGTMGSSFGGRYESHGGVVVFDTLTFDQIDDLNSDDGHVSFLAFLEGGKTLATSTGVDTKLWNVARKAIVDNIPNFGATAISGDGQRLISYSGRRFQMLDWEGIPLGEPLLQPARSCSLSFDGQIAVTVDYDEGNLVTLWDTNTWMPLGPRKVCPGNVISASFASDDSSVTVGCDSGITRRWQLPAQIRLDEPERLKLSVEVRTGLEFTNGKIHELTQKQWLEKKQKLAELGGPIDIAR